MISLDKSLFRKATLALSLCGAVAFPFSAAIAADNTVDIVPDETIDGNVELNPGYIAGQFNIGGQNISRIDLNAASSDYSAKIYPSAEGPYNLTVNVPAGTSLDYTVSGTVWMDNWNTRMFLSDRTVAVAEAQTTQLDIIINSGYVTGEIITNGCNLAKTELWAVRNDTGGYSNATTKMGSETQFRFPVQPNNDVRVYGQVQLSTGATYNLANHYLNIVPGQDTTVNWELNCTAGELSKIQHDVNYHMPIDYNYSYLYNQGAWSPYKTVRHDGSVLFDNLAPDTWRIYTYSYWNNNQNLIAKNFTGIITQSGETTNVTFDQYPGFLRGTLTLTGTHTIQDTSYAHVYSYGQNSLYPSYQVFSRSLAAKSDGSFNLALPYGEYSTYVSAFSFYHPIAGEDYLNSYLYMYDYSKRGDLLFINPGEIIEGHDISYETGSAIIKYSIADGGVFSSPYINAKCYNYDENNTLQSYIYSNSRGLVNDDRVTMIGLPGTYEVEAWAYVDGSLTTFGKVEIEIVSGVEKVIDIGGPVLRVSDPVAGAVVSENSITVIGTATDETGIEKIIVNGNEVEFFSTSNPDDLNEVVFNTTIELAEGENAIVTVATDPSGNESKDSRSVTYTPPVTPPELPKSIGAIIDIKPGSCKNPFNVTSKGVLPVVVLGTPDLDVRDIDPDSIFLQDVAPLRYTIDDAAEYVTDQSCNTDQSDGFEDLVLKFETQEIVSVLGEVNDGDIITLTLTGSSYDDEELEAQDSITIIKRGKNKR